MEVAIDEECSRILATRAPTASDLRLIIAIIKTITDLERIGDEAEKVGVLAARLASVERPSTNYRELRNLAQHVKKMVRNTLDAFARLDALAALEVVKADDVVDEEYESIYRQGITFMMEDPRTISRVMDTTWMARALERIGDHAKNICEYVIFMVHGKDIRYMGLDSIEEEVRKGVRREEAGS
jgi:phosphate transport system protein